jgi:hypothetical protein
MSASIDCFKDGNTNKIPCQDMMNAQHGTRWKEGSIDDEAGFAAPLKSNVNSPAPENVTFLGRTAKTSNENGTSASNTLIIFLKLLGDKSLLFTRRFNITFNKPA